MLVPIVLIGLFFVFFVYFVFVFILPVRLIHRILFVLVLLDIHIDTARTNDRTSEQKLT
ncbi:MAG: hypothetical protein KDA28_06260 [Phycisphaerales bacterium]|nr:hypothetical protein [Phycisphaerales bacterium]